MGIDVQTDLDVRPAALPLQQSVQDAPHRHLLHWVVATNNVAGGAKASEEVHVHGGSSGA